MADPRRRTPRTDTVLDAPDVRAACTRLGRTRVKATVGEVLEACRQGRVEPDDVVPVVLACLPPAATSLRRVVNATGVVVHTNLGRAPLSASAVEAVTIASGATDVELDLVSGRRGSRGSAALAALAAAVPDAGGVHVVNNGAAALALVTCAMAFGREVVVARGELVEIGDGFRVPELVESVGGRLREVGTTNRVRLEDYRDVVGEQTAFVLKVHPSNFRVEGFTSTVAVGELAMSASRWWPTSAPACWRPTRGCPTSPTRRRTSAPAPPWSRHPVTSCSAARSAGCCSATPRSCSGCGDIRSPAPCASTS